MLIALLMAVSSKSCQIYCSGLCFEVWRIHWPHISCSASDTKWNVKLGGHTHIIWH